MVRLQLLRWFCRRFAKAIIVIFAIVAFGIVIAISIASFSKKEPPSTLAFKPAFHSVTNKSHMSSYWEGITPSVSTDKGKDS